MKFEDLRQRIAKADVVSFDIFDTLIVRLYAKPTDLFRHLEESYEAGGFCAARISAEMAARDEVFQNQCHEVTLDKIYENLHPSYWPLQEKEVELEKLMCKANPEMLELFSWCKEQGKRIIISSDMYLPIAVIEEILQNAGYMGYKKLFLSSETKRPKATGEMYDDLLTYCGVSTNQILHIGDNPYTDYEIALQKGLSAYCYEPICKSVGDNYHSSYFALLNQYAEKEVAPSILKGMITLHDAQNPTEDYWVNFGYQYAGMLMVSYCQWLKEQFDKNGIKKAYFMLRDGYIVKEVFDCLYPEFETHQIYGSRRMFLFARMKKYEDIQEYITSLIEGVSFDMLYKRLLIDSDELYAKYCERFPRQEETVDDKDAINRFFADNIGILLGIADKERKLIAKYIHSIHLDNTPTAIVDLGWRCSMLKGISAVLETEHMEQNLYGYYLGTHHFKSNRLRIESFALNNGNPNNEADIRSTMNSLYIIDILEMIFTAPHSSILKINKDLTPVYQTRTPQEQSRIDNCSSIMSGIILFLEEYLEIYSKNPIKISVDSALISMKYFRDDISEYDRNKISAVFVLPGLGDDDTCFPLVNCGRGLVGIINPWGASLGAESEAILRIRSAIKNLGYDCVLLNSAGMILDSQFRLSGAFIQKDKLTYVISLNYETPKIVDAFYYYTIWSPPEMSLRLEDYTPRLSNNILMNDDYLIYDNGGMSNQLQSILLNKERNICAASILTASFPLSSMIKPTLGNHKIFYCGMNWEKIEEAEIRHEGLFKLLDNDGNTRIYGPERMDDWGGMRPWEGYSSYCGQIPFDGFSILKEINDCGICLVLSSDIHRRAGAVTNRAYEACAAGAVMISDDNEFMMKHFGDASLFITFNKNNPRDTYRQIMEKYEWICSHPQEALALANRAQEIFREKFSLDVQLRQMILNHPNRVRQIQKDLYAKDDTKKVLVTYVCNTISLPQGEQYLKKVFQSVQNQYYKNIELGIAVDKTIYGHIDELCRCKCANATVVPMELFDSKGSKKMTDGQAIRSLQSQIEHEYYININAKETWFTDHITTLIRTLEDEASLGVCSGVCLEDINGYKRVEFFDLPHLDKLYQMSGGQFPSGMFLFHKNAHQILPDFLFDCVDGYEHYIYGNMLQYRKKSPISFSRRMTLSHVENGEDNRNIVLSADKQQRFIQDLVRFHLPEGTGNMEAVSMPSATVPVPNGNALSFADMLQMVPIKSLVKIRYYRWKLRKLKPGSAAFQKIDEKYQAALNRYHEYWGLQR